MGLNCVFTVSKQFETRALVGILLFFRTTDRTILLGQSIQISSLENLYTYGNSFNFMTYLTVEPNKKEIMPYLKSFNEKLLLDTNSKLIVFGPQQIEIDLNNLPNKIELYRSVETFINNYFEEKMYA